MLTATPIKSAKDAAKYYYGKGEWYGKGSQSIGLSGNVLRPRLFGNIYPILNAYYTKLCNIKYLASPELRHGSTQLNILHYLTA